MANPTPNKPRTLRVVGSGARLIPGALAPRQTALLGSLRDLALDADCAELAAAVESLSTLGMSHAALGEAVRAIATIAAEAAPRADTEGGTLARAQARDVARAANALAMVAAEIRRLAGR